MEGESAAVKLPEHIAVSETVLREVARRYHVPPAEPFGVLPKKKAFSTRTTRLVRTSSCVFRASTPSTSPPSAANPWRFRRLPTDGMSNDYSGPVHAGFAPKPGANVLAGSKPARRHCPARVQPRLEPRTLAHDALDLVTTDVKSCHNIAQGYARPKAIDNVCTTCGRLYRQA
jgi:hypothetical protein